MSYPMADAQSENRKRSPLQGRTAGRVSRAPEAVVLAEHKATLALAGGGEHLRIGRVPHLIFRLQRGALAAPTGSRRHGSAPGAANSAGDHVIARSRGGPEGAQNYLPLCRSCNARTLRRYDGVRACAPSGAILGRANIISSGAGAKDTAPRDPRRRSPLSVSLSMTEMLARIKRDLTILEWMTRVNLVLTFIIFLKVFSC